MKKSNNITAYVHAGNYIKIGEFQNFESIFSQIVPPAGPYSIGIDGPASGGKTTVTDALTKYYSAKNIPVTVLPLDFFMSDRNVRSKLNNDIAQGIIPIDSYSLHGWDHPRYLQYLKMLKEIIEQKSGSIKHISIQNAYSRKSGKRDKNETRTVVPQGIVITEGTGIHLYHKELFDLSIRVDVNNTKILLNRVVSREKEKPVESQLTVDYLLERYQNTDVPHAAYLRNQTQRVADIVIDTSTLPLVVFKKS